MDHPPFIPATLVINHEQAGEIGKDVNEGPNVVGIRRQPRLGFHDKTDRADGRQSAIRAGCGQHGAVVGAHNLAGKDVRLETARTE